MPNLATAILLPHKAMEKRKIGQKEKARHYPQWVVWLFILLFYGCAFVHILPGFLKFVYK